MPRRGLGVMGKVPVAGAVETRLTPLDGEQAALLYRAFLRDTLLVGVSIPDCHVSVIHPPAADVSILRALLPAGVDLMLQTGRGLGDGMRGAFRSMWERGFGVVVLTGSDVPSLPASVVEEAFVRLEEDDCDVVLGPATDGGYYLIGLRHDQPVLFDDITWSTNVVLQQTLDRAASIGLRVRLLQTWNDVDDAAGLGRLIHDLGSDPELHAPATRVALRTLRRQGTPLPDSPAPWIRTSTERRLESPWRHLDVDQLTTHTGATIEYTYFTTPDAVWVVPVTRQGDILLVRQYRAPVRDWCLEVPAGSVTGQSLEDDVRRELREEVGATASELRSIGAFSSASAHLTLRGHVFLALDVEIGETQPEDTELLVTVTIPAETAFEMARRGEIDQVESALAILLCERDIRAHLARM